MDDTIHILYGGGPGYIAVVGISMVSVIWNNPHRKLHFHFLIDDFDYPKEEIDKFRQVYALYRNVVAIDLKKVRVDNPAIQAFMSMPCRLPPTTYYRCLGADMYPDVDKMLWLDGDILCLNDISPLYDIDLGEALYAGRPCDAPPYNFIGGVVLMDCAGWRRTNALAKMVKYAREQGPTTNGADQELIWAGCEGRILPLEDERMQYYVRTNRPLTEGHGETIPDDVILAHYLGAPSKPWQVTCFDRRADLWHLYRMRSPWHDMKLQGEGTEVDAYVKHLKRLYEEGQREIAEKAYKDLVSTWEGKDPDVAVFW